MLLYILIGLTVLVVGLLIVASLKPNTAHYERTTVINAPPDRILPHVVDFHQWKSWSPWEKLDPNMKRHHLGAAQGVGAKYAWSGNGKAGEGTMEVLEASTSGVKIDLRFVRPFKNDCITHFHFTPQGGGHHRSLDHGWPQPVRREAHEHVHSHGQDDRQGLRAGLGRIESRSRETLTHSHMAHYVDGFMIAVPKKELARYKKLATAAGKVWMDHGALQYMECAGDDLEHEGIAYPFPKAAKCKPGDTVVFSWIVYRNRKHRDQVNKKVMADPRMDKMYREQMASPIFDHKRMAYGGFVTLVEQNK